VSGCPSDDLNAATAPGRSPLGRRGGALADGGRCTARGRTRDVGTQHATAVSFDPTRRGLGCRRPGTPSIGKAFGRAVLSRPKGATSEEDPRADLLHPAPIAVFLIWITVWFNKNLNTGQKIVWAIVSIVPLVPFVYVLTGNDFL